MASMFTCGPNCENRKPGCHDHCEKYQRERAAYDKRKAELDKDREVMNYTLKLITKRANYRAIHNRNDRRRKWSRGN